MTDLRLSTEQKLDWLQLIRCENVGPRTFRALLNRHGGAAQALAALPELIRRGKGRAIVMATRESVLREWERAERLGARFVALGEGEYPPGLRAIEAPPPLLCLRGKAEIFEKPMVALVGSRNASAAGLAMTEKLARGLGAAGYAVVSGLARGIDACAHRAALASGTIGVLAGGLDRPYPPENLGLIEQIAQTGAVVSEMPFGYEPRGRDFPRRNRIVSGLTLATVVVEAARRSGSLITARFAQEQGREVFAVPGSPLDPRAEGANDLIREGAYLCGGADEIIDLLAPLAARGATRYDLLFEPDPVPFEEPLWDELEGLDFPGGFPAAPPREKQPQNAPGESPEGAPEALPEALPPPRQRVEALLGPAPIGMDDLARASGSSIGEIRLILQELEIEGRIERHGGDRVSLIDRDWRQ
ncbi:DNA-processing protein DprA [uncultured Rhodoblastus sp.]|uniref:DNA-processing protein DprA n=1 Tax=uncultured Rhodoblastus sp. TaxID=543037 RepID=UPI0025E6396D|nr:DNA-processing protein DprA [uncultured Rhodoblastus sp.]